MDLTATGLADRDEWVDALRGSGPEREETAQRLHALLLRVARRELARRGGQLPVGGPERDDLAYQAAADAMSALLAKLDDFRGESRFTTWAYRFVILEVSSKIGRHFWRTRPVFVPGHDWDLLPDRLGLSPEHEVEARDLVAALRRAIDEELTPRERDVFHALVLDAVPLDALVVRLGTNRNAVYQVMFKARRKLRAALVSDGFLDRSESA